jgi:tetratricopeptide (TPR) repeat protein
MALFIAAAYRDTELGRDDPLADMLADLRREPGVERLVLGGLDVAGVGAFVEARTARTLDGAGLALARALHTETDGNPFFVGELLRHVVDADGAFVGAATLALPRQLGADALDVPEGVREVIGRRLARLSDVTNRALSAAAAIGPTFSLALLRQVDETVDPEDLLDALDEAVQARLIEEVPGPTGQYAFSHSLVRQALYAEFSAARRARLHRRVGEAIERLYGEDDGRLPALAYHFGEAASVGQTDRAADYGLLAATQALGQLAHEEAAALAERALRALALEDTPDRTRRCPLLLVLAQARIGTADVPGGKEAARQAAADARALGSAQWLSEAAVLRTIVAVGTPDPEVAAICEEALAMLGDQHPGLRARVMASLAYYRTLAESRPDEAAKLAEPALALARETGDLEALAFAMFTRARSLTGVGRTLDKLALADELVALGESTRDDFILAQGLQARAPTLLVVGDVAGFDADAARLADLADRLRSWSFLALTAEWRALRAFMDGRFDDAEPLVGEVLVHGSRSVDYVNVYAAQQFFLYWDRGRVTELLPLVQQAVDDNPTVVTFKAALALIHAKRGDPDSVRPHWEALAANDFAGVPPGVTWTGSAFILTELCALVGDADRARVLYDRIVPYAGKTLTIAFGIYCAGAADRFLGMLALTAGRVALAVDHCEAALALEQRLGSPPLIARSKFWLARSLLARDDPGDQDRARMLLTEAADAAAKLGMAALGEDAGQLLA